MRTIIFISLLFVANVSFTQVAFDAASESHTGTVGSVSEASFSWTHTTSASPEGVLVFTYNISTATVLCTGVTYGGVAMTAVTGGEAAKSGGEEGTCKAWFLASSIPTGNQTVVVSRTNNSTECYAVAITVTAGAATEVYEAGIVTIATTTALAEQNVDDGSPGTNSLRFSGVFTGKASPPVAGANSTLLHSMDVAATTVSISTVRETTAGQGSRLVGHTYVTSDDVAAIHLAVREVPTSSTKVIIIQ